MLYWKEVSIFSNYVGRECGRISSNQTRPNCFVNCCGGSSNFMLWRVFLEWVQWSWSELIGRQMEPNTAAERSSIYSLKSQLSQFINLLTKKPTIVSENLKLTKISLNWPKIKQWKSDIPLSFSTFLFYCFNLFEGPLSAFCSLRR